MKIHDALDIALKSITGRLYECPVEPKRNRDQRQSAEKPGAAFLWLLFFH
jgi:hypothetical protein